MRAAGRVDAVEVLEHERIEREHAVEVEAVEAGAPRGVAGSAFHARSHSTNASISWLRHIQVGKRANGAPSGRCAVRQALHVAIRRGAASGQSASTATMVKPRARISSCVMRARMRVELGRAVRRLADQHDARVADALEQRAEIGRSIDLGSGSAALADEHATRVAGRLGARAGRAVPLGSLRRPALGADQRHEAHVAEVLAREGCRPPPESRARGVCSVAALADRDDEPAARRELLEQRLGTVGPPAATTIAS